MRTDTIPGYRVFTEWVIAQTLGPGPSGFVLPPLLISYDILAPLCLRVLIYKMEQ